MGSASLNSQPMPDEWLAEHFDHLAPELAPCMNETLSRMRQICPVPHSDRYGGFWVVSKYEDVLNVLQDWETFSSAHGMSIPDSAALVRMPPVEVDPPEQRIFKRVITPYFTPAAVAAWEQPTREIVSALIDDFVDEGSCDFMEAFARPFPSLAFFRLAISAPADELDHVAYLASKSASPTDPAAAECWQGLYAWIKQFVARRRAQPPCGDVIDAVLTADIGGRPISEEEIIGAVQVLILGGLETTASALGLMFHRFCRHTEIPEQLRRSPERIPAAVEELLRIDTPFIAVARTVMRDGKIGEQPVKEGDKVLVYWASANRDDAEFANADQFDLDRRPNRHFAFGVGPHRCAGSNVARMNLRVALEELLSRLIDIRLQDGAEVEYHSTHTRSPVTLPITFTARARG